MDNQILAGGNQSIIYQAYSYAPSNYIMGFTSSPLLLQCFDHSSYLCKRLDSLSLLYKESLYKVKELVLFKPSGPRPKPACA